MVNWVGQVRRKLLRVSSDTRHERLSKQQRSEAAGITNLNASSNSELLNMKHV